MTDDIKAVLLVGGKGTRLRSVVPTAPKPLAKVGGKSFLDLVVRQLRHQGIRRLVMCTGYLADQIEEEFGDGRAWNVEIEYSREQQVLGTAGALRLARNYLQGVPEFIVMNGDSFLEVDFHQLVRFHREHSGLASLAVLQVKNASRYGTVQLDPSGRVRGFTEKMGSDVPGPVNAGVYIFNSSVFQYIPEGSASLERDVFPRLLDHGVYGLEQHGMFIDIGTPEDYALAQRLFCRLDEAALQPRASRSRENNGQQFKESVMDGEGMSDTNAFEQRVRRSMRASIAVKEQLLGSAEVVSMIAEVSKILVRALEQGNKALLFGNGGSAADAQHIAAEFVGRFAFDRPALPALALSVNTSCVTAIGNDYGFELVFSRQIEALARPGDVAIGISTSGNSGNVLQAMTAARKMKLHTVAFTGCTGGELKNAVDHCICAPSNETPRIQECHILIGHIISELVEQTIFHEQSCVSRS